MTMTPTITFRRMRGTEALDADIRARLEKLERYCPTLMGARVLVEPLARHHRAGTHYHIRIDITVPGEEIAITHEASLRPTTRALAARKTQKQDEQTRRRSSWAWRSASLLPSRAGGSRTTCAGVVER